MPKFNAAHRAKGRIKTNASGCMVWTGAKLEKGYGVAKKDGKAVYPHRVALEESLGRPIKEGFHACHRCPTPHA